MDMEAGAQRISRRRPKFRRLKQISNQVVTSMKPTSILRKWHYATTLCLMIAGHSIPLYSVDTDTRTEHLPVDLIIEKLQAANLRRTDALSSYTGKRVYKLAYRGFPGSRHAEMIVEAAYTSPDQKTFRIISEKRIQASASTCIASPSGH